MSDPLPLSRGQLRALTAAATRELSWGLRAASREMRGWRRRARMIPDDPIREDALETLRRKRTHIVGAGLFSILPGRRDRRLLRVLVAYEIIIEFLDNAHERAAHQRNGRQLHRALVEALDPSAPISDYYLHHPWKDDGGYLRALVEACREGCVSLPFYEEVRRMLLQGASRCGGVQSLNHEPDSSRRGVALREWSERQFPEEREADWWELTAAASSSLGVHALLATASCDRHDWALVNAAYVPWICTVSTLLDSYVDEVADMADARHSYLAYYPSREVAVRRLSELIRRSAREARDLPGGHRHAVIAACMVAMYLSNDRVRGPSMRANTDRLAAAGGSLTRVLLPVLRLWRAAYAQRSA
jgi:tetraprenyl-beta-curcumene synthase